ncbi:hypothetical protein CAUPRSCDRAFT_11038 [Caulochytrium protostelioides]|uniref:Uncharacterized protein n=1 Tax=Caulochytrium protostelioides TaxID=1555241 RepID=A0A4P9WVD4_9FUNG|nr:hypothetical protein CAUPRSCDRAFT_11038 [Caulochytrium protostelioides]
MKHHVGAGEHLVDGLALGVVGGYDGGAALRAVLGEPLLAQPELLERGTLLALPGDGGGGGHARLGGLANLGERLRIRGAGGVGPRRLTVAPYADGLGEALCLGRQMCRKRREIGLDGADARHLRHNGLRRAGDAVRRHVVGELYEAQHGIVLGSVSTGTSTGVKSGMPFDVSVIATGIADDAGGADGANGDVTVAACILAPSSSGSAHQAALPVSMAGIAGDPGDAVVKEERFATGEDDIANDDEENDRGAVSDEVTIVEEGGGQTPARGIIADAMADGDAPYIC